MKRKSISKKLIIKKEIIANLDKQDLKDVKGGVSLTCWVIESKCMCEW